MKKVLLIALLGLTMFSCADSKEFTIDNKQVVVEPYGWIDKNDVRNDSVKYEVNVPNLLLSIVFVETLVVPIYLTGTQFYEPVAKK